MSHDARVKSVRRLALLGLGALVGLGCTPVSLERNPFLTYAGAFGFLDTPEDGASGRRGETGEEIFRDNLTVTFRNLHDTAEVETAFAAWVNVSSVRSAAQQDALLRAGYVQLVEEFRLGAVFTLPIGTFVYGGPGLAGATAVRLGTAISTQALPTELTVALVTPDVFLVFRQPPVSCDSVAFDYVNPEVGRAATGSATSEGGSKTYAQVDVYQCAPLRPGLFLDVDAGTRARNEFAEGSTITVSFSRVPSDDGYFATITIED